MRYKQGDLRIVRYSMVSPYEPRAYIVEESRTSKRVSKDLMLEDDALLLMRELGSPYIGSRYGKSWPDQLVETAMEPLKVYIDLSVWNAIEPVRKSTRSLLIDAIKPIGWK